MNDYEINPEMAKRMFEQMMTLFVEPEIKRRQNEGRLQVPFNLTGAQIVFPPDGKMPIVKLNAEVKAIAKIKLKDGIAKKAGETIYGNEVEEFGQLTLLDDEADCGHVTMFHSSGQTWTLSFDLVYNKKMSNTHLKASEEFLASAEDNLKKKRWSPFIEDLFASCELIAKAILLGMPDPKFREKASHSGIHVRFNKFAKLGNIKDDYSRTLNELSALRTPARYLRGGELKIEVTKANHLLEVVKEMKEHAGQRIAR